jgi:cytochrome P450
MSQSASLEHPTFDHDIFSTESILNPYEYDGRMREAAPIVWLEGCQSWFVGRHAECQEIYSNPRLFSSRVLPFNSTNSIAPPVLLSEDPPKHTGEKTTIQSVFTPGKVKAAAVGFRPVADEMVDALIAEGTGDGYEIAETFILRVFPDMLGLPQENRKALVDFGQAVLNSFAPMNDLTRAALEKAGWGFEWITTQCARDKVTKDGFAEKIYALSDEGKITEEVAGFFVRTVLAAGFDTTILSLTNAIALFARHPDQWAMMRADRRLVGNAFDEVLRYMPPGRYSNRAAKEDCVVGGVRMRAGDQIALGIAAAGRDPRRWDDPDRFDITRKASGHLAFGFGIHACIGQVLARLEYEAMINAMLDRIERLELIEEPSVLMNNVTTGFSRVPIRVHAAI